MTTTTIPTPAATSHQHNGAGRQRRAIPADLRQWLDEELEQRIEYYASQPDYVISQRIEDLKREWSVHRTLQLKVATFGLVTAFMALTGNRRWALATAAAFGFFGVYGLQSAEPPIPALRRIGLRSRAEIDREIYALKVLRGDFNGLPDRTVANRVAARDILAAVKK